MTVGNQITSHFYTCYAIYTTSSLWIEEDITKDASHGSDGHEVHIMCGTNFALRAHCERTAGTLRAHCGRTAGTCIKDHPEEMEGGNIKQHMRMRQHNITI